MVENGSRHRQIREREENRGSADAERRENAAWIRSSSTASGSFFVESERRQQRNLHANLSLQHSAPPAWRNRSRGRRRMMPSVRVLPPAYATHSAAAVRTGDPRGTVRDAAPGRPRAARPAPRRVRRRAHRTGPRVDHDLNRYTRVPLARPRPVALMPRDPACAPLVVAFSSFPEVRRRGSAAGTGTAFPVCGCDACDESAEGEADSIPAAGARRHSGTRPRGTRNRAATVRWLTSGSGSRPASTGGRSSCWNPQRLPASSSGRAHTGSRGSVGEDYEQGAGMVRAGSGGSIRSDLKFQRRHRRGRELPLPAERFFHGLMTSAAFRYETSTDGSSAISNTRPLAGG